MPPKWVWGHFAFVIPSECVWNKTTTRSSMAVKEGDTTRRNDNKEAQQSQPREKKASKQASKNKSLPRDNPTIWLVERREARKEASNEARDKATITTTATVLSHHSNESTSERQEEEGKQGG